MPRGYAGKFLDINLSTERVKEVSFDEEVLRQYIGGRGLAAKILWDELGGKWSEVDPLSPENILLILTGPLTGYVLGSRICISGKSPLTNGIIGSTVAGTFPMELKCSGYDGLIIRGRAKSPVYIYIQDERVEIRDASHVWGKGSRETVRTLIKEVREELSKKHPNVGVWRDPGLLYIGPAGENKVRISAVLAGWVSAAGRGGYGAVMGSKNLKAVVAKGTGPLPEPYNPVRTRELMNYFLEEVRKNDELRRWGTGYGGYEVGYSTSSEPIRNWQEEWHDRKEYGVDEFERTVWVKHYWSGGHYGCPVTCLKLSVIREGEFKGAITDNPDYENQAMLGTNLGVFTPEGTVYLTYLADELGFDGISLGAVLGFAAELYQRGILKKEDLNGIDLSWGNVKGFGQLARKIAFREGIGDTLAEGTYRAAVKIGGDALKYAVQVKGLEVGAHGIRSRLDYPHPISYACSVHGGDHTSVAQLPIRAPNSELQWLLYDSLVICLFIFIYPVIKQIWEMVEAVTGWHITEDEWFNVMAKRIAHIQRAALLLGGPDVAWKPDRDDDNPPRFYEPLPSGPKKGQFVPREEVMKHRAEYYKEIGWDEKGIPKSDVLKELGLKSVDKALEKVRKSI